MTKPKPMPFAKFGGLVQTKLTDALFVRHHCRLDAVADEVADALVVRLHYQLACVLDGQRVVSAWEDVPRSWWDGLKLALLPRWLRRLFPAQLRRINTVVEVRRLCAHLQGDPNRWHLEFLLHGKEPAP